MGENKTITHDFKVFFFRSFVICHKRATACLFHVGASQNYCLSYLSSCRSDGGLTMQVSFLKDKPNMRAVAKGHTPEVAGRHRSSIRVMHSKSQAHAVVYSTQQNRSQGARDGRGAAPWGNRSARVAEDLSRSSNPLHYLH